MSAKFDFGTLDAAFEADWPVDVNVPQDGGTVKTERFMARFRLLDADALEKLVGSGEFGLSSMPKAYFVGFGAGETMTFSEALRDQMIGRTYIRAALERAYQNFASGVAIKN